MGRPRSNTVCVTKKTRKSVIENESVIEIYQNNEKEDDSGSERDSKLAAKGKRRNTTDEKTSKGAKGIKKGSREIERLLAFQKTLGMFIDTNEPRTTRKRKQTAPPPSPPKKKTLKRLIKAPTPMPKPKPTPKQAVKKNAVKPAPAINLPVDSPDLQIPSPSTVVSPLPLNGSIRRCTTDCKTKSKPKTERRKSIAGSVLPESSASIENFYDFTRYVDMQHKPCGSMKVTYCAMRNMPIKLLNYGIIHMEPWSSRASYDSGEYPMVSFLLKKLQLSFKFSLNFYRNFSFSKVR
jgi:hypothetical protein